jgi:hypothetical protein
MTANGAHPPESPGPVKSDDKFHRAVTAVRQLAGADSSAREELARMLETDAKAENLAFILGAFERRQPSDPPAPVAQQEAAPAICFPPTPPERAPDNKDESGASVHHRWPEKGSDGRENDVAVPPAMRRMSLIVLTVPAAAAIMTVAWAPWVLSEALAYMRSAKGATSELLALASDRERAQVAAKPSADQRASVENVSREGLRPAVIGISPSPSDDSPVTSGSIAGTMAENMQVAAPAPPVPGSAASSDVEIPALTDPVPVGPAPPVQSDDLVIVPNVPAIEPLQASDFGPLLTEASAASPGAEPSAAGIENVVVPTPPEVGEPDFAAPIAASAAAPPHQTPAAIAEPPTREHQSDEGQQAAILPEGTVESLAEPEAKPASEPQFSAALLPPFQTAIDPRRDLILQLLADIAESLEFKQQVAAERERAAALARELASAREEIGALRLRSPAPSVPTPEDSTTKPPAEPASPAAVAARAAPTDLAAPVVRIEEPAAASRSAPSPVQAPSVSERRLIERAEALLRDRDISGARLLLERATALGSARGNYLLAKTYDPVVLALWQVKGIQGDPVKARQLYDKARAAYSGAATESVGPR